MNPPSNPQSEPTWVSHDTWEHTAAHSTSQYQATASSRPPEWDWDNQLLLVPQSSPEIAVDRKPQIVMSLPTASICNRPYSNNYAAAIPPSFAHQQQQEHHNSVADPPFNVPLATGRSSYPGLEGPYHHHSTLVQTGLVSSLGQQQGGGATSTTDHLNAELRSYEQRRRFLGMQMLDPDHSRNLLDFVKREDMYSLGEHARIGLNLGGRTYFSSEDSARFGKRTRLSSVTHAPMCQVQGCTADLGKAKHYHRRHKVCEIHSKAPNVIANGQTQRFCQQCSRFHQLSEFDDTKRSCRKRLADHNRRRRKPQASAVVTVSETCKAEDQSTNIRQNEGDHKPVLLHIQKTSSPTASKDSISTGGNRLLQNQPAAYGQVEEKQIVSRESLLRNHQALPSSHVQALVLSVVSRTPSSTAQLTNRQSPATQESVYHQYLQGPSLSLSSAGVSSSHTTNNNNSQSSQNYSSMEQHSIAWLGPNTGSRSTLLQTRPLETQQSQAFSGKETRSHQLQGISSNTNQHFLLNNVNKSSDWVMENMPRPEQLGRLGTQGVQAGSMDGRQMLALMENPSQQQHQQPATTLHDVKPLQRSDMQHSVRSSFCSSFYDSSSSIG